MTDVLIPAMVLAASLAATYFFCLRPMRRGHCAGGRLTSPAPGHAAAEKRDAEIARLRAEVAALRSSAPEEERNA